MKLRNIVTIVCILLCISRATYADVIELCQVRAAHANVEGVVINPVTAYRTESCQLNLTDIAPNSWVHLKFHHRDTILQLCNNRRVNISCPGDRDMRVCSNGNITCYVPRNATTSQTITVIVHGRIITNLPGLFMSYRVAQVVLNETSNASVYSSDVIGNYGYIVSDSRYPESRREYHRNTVHTLTVRLPRQYQERNISVSIIDIGIGTYNCDQFSIMLNSQTTICSDNATILGEYRIRSTMQADTRQGFNISFRLNVWYARGFMLLYKEAGRTIDTIKSTTITPRTTAASPQHTGYTGTSSTHLPEDMSTTCQCPTVSTTKGTNTDMVFIPSTSTVEEAATDLSSLQGTIAEHQETITTLTAICVVLGLLLSIVSVVLVIPVIKQRPCCAMNKADYPGEFAVNRAYSSGAVTSAPSPHDTGFAAKSRATPIGGNDYSYVGDHILADRGVYQEPNKSHEDHVYAGTDYYDLADDTELSPQCNQYKLADEIEPIADRKQEEDNFYHCVEPSAPPGSTLPTGQYVDVESLQASTELAQNQVETTTKISETDADDGYIDLSKVPAEHVRLSALLDTENHEGDQGDNVELVENTLYHSQS